MPVEMKFIIWYRHTMLRRSYPVHCTCVSHANIANKGHRTTLYKYTSTVCLKKWNPNDIGFQFRRTNCLVSFASTVYAVGCSSNKFVLHFLALYAIARPSVRLSVTRVDQSKTVERIIEILSPSDRPIILVFRHQRSLRKSDGFTPNGGAKYKGCSKN